MLVFRLPRVLVPLGATLARGGKCYVVTLVTTSARTTACALSETLWTIGRWSYRQSVVKSTTTNISMIPLPSVGGTTTVRNTLNKEMSSVPITLFGSRPLVTILVVALTD